MPPISSSPVRYDIRRARADELPAVQRLLKCVWHATYDKTLGPEKVEEITESWHALHALEAAGRRENHVRLVALVGDQIVATSGATLFDDEVVELHQLYILPEHQGQGLGRKLFEATVAQFPRAHRIGLEVEPSNARAIAAYEKWGFQCLGTVDDCGSAGSGIRARVYEKQLTDRQA